MTGCLRVGLVIKHFTESLGGAERHSVVLARELLRLGHEVHVFAAEFDRCTEDLPIQVHPVRVRRRSGARKILSFAFGVRTALEGVDLDVVHGLTQIWPQDVHRAGGGVHCWWFRQKYPNRFVRFFARWSPKEIVQHRVETEIYRRGHVRVVTTNSELVRGQLLEAYDLEPEQVVVVRNGVDPATFGLHVQDRFREGVREELALDPPEAPLVLFASNNYGRKGLGTLLRALARVEGVPVHLAVVGNGRERKFRTLAERLNVADRTRFLGRTDRPERLYAAGDLFVLPTLHDPFANVCLEAMACGLGVVTTRTNGAAEILTPGENGFVLEDPRDSEELAIRLQGLLEDPEGVRRLGERAREASLPFTPEANACRNVEIYRRAIERKG